MKRILKTGGGILAAIIVLPVLIGMTWKALSPEIPAPGMLFDVGGHEMHIYCTGPDNDLPAVIIEGGLGGPTSFYHWVQENLSMTGKVCTYDRAGLGWSEESGVPHDAEHITAQLHRLLEKEGVKKPFVFAGHSIAGLYMRVYVGHYPKDVVAVAFLDASHPKQNEILKRGNDGIEKAKKVYGILKVLNNLGLTKFYNPVISMFKGHFPDEIIDQMAFNSTNVYYDASVAEMEGLNASNQQTLQAGDLGNRPVVVISAGHLASKKQGAAGIDPVERRKLWLGLHNDLKQLSTRGRHIVIDEAGHMNLLYDKEIADQVADFIREIVMESTLIISENSGK